MRKFFINHVRHFMITTIIINIIIFLVIFSPIDSILFFLFSLVLFVILEFDIYIILLNILEYKTNKYVMALLNTCNPDLYIESLKKDLSIINKKKNNNKYEENRFNLYKVEIFKYGITDDTIDKLESININNFYSFMKKSYKLQLAIVYLRMNEYEKADLLINSLDKEKDKEDIELLNEVKILLSDEEKDQEEYFINRFKNNKNDYLLNKITYIRDLSTYYLKIHKYNNARLCLNYIIEYGGNLNYVKNSKSKLEEIKDVKSKDEIHPDLNYLLFDVKSKTLNTSKIKINSIAIGSLIIILCLVNFISDKTLFGISGSHFKKYMDKNVCNVYYHRNFNNIDKVNYAYMTSKKCKYNVGYIEYENEDDRDTPDKIAKYLQEKYNLIESSVDRSSNNDPYDSIIYNGIYYAKIYRKENTLIYIIANKKDQEKAISILKALRYDDKYPLRSLFN